MIAFNNPAKYTPSGLYHSSFSLKYYCHHELLNCHRGCFTEKGIPKSFAKFTGKYLCQSLILIQLRASGWPATLLKKSHWHRCLLVSFEKLLRPPFLQNTSAGLLLNCVFSNSWVFIFPQHQHVDAFLWCFLLFFTSREWYLLLIFLC